MQSHQGFPALGEIGPDDITVVDEHESDQWPYSSYSDDTSWCDYQMGTLKNKKYLWYTLFFERCAYGGMARLIH